MRAGATKLLKTGPETVPKSEAALSLRALWAVQLVINCAKTHLPGHKNARMELKGRGLPGCDGSEARYA